MKRFINVLGAASLMLIGSFAMAFGQDDLLDNEEAFKLKATAVSSEQIELQFTIAKGYYLYRDRIQISSPDLAGPIIRPEGEFKKDPNFGDVYVYKSRATLTLPITRGARSVQLEINSQGCADVGVCYPPLKRTLQVEMPASTPSGLAGIKSLDQLLSKGSAQNDQPLEVDQAFRFSLSSQSLEGTIAPGYYLYQDKITLSQNGQTISLNLPVASPKKDPLFGDVLIYQNNLSIPLPSGLSGPFELSYQGCWEGGICYPPVTQTFEFGGAAFGTAFESSAAMASDEAVLSTLKNSGYWIVILTFFGFGLLLAFTPCVFPMIPILSGIIVGQGPSITPRKAFFISLVYVLAMALTYTLAGVLAGLFGENLQAAFQNPWIIGAFAAIFVALALSMFGFYELQLPASLQTKLSELSNRQQGGSLSGAAIMGLLSALIVGPCVAPPLAGALVYIGQTGDALLGGSALFALSMGMGLPLLLVGTAAGKFLPRAGGWMDTIKAVFGILMLGVAIWMLERVVAFEITLALWSMLLIASAVYVGAFKSDTHGWHNLWKALGILLLAWGLILLVSLASGGHSLLKPLAHLQSTGVSGAIAPQTSVFKTVKTGDSLEQAMLQAQSQGKPMVIDLYADWCVSCKELEAFTFSDPQVQALLAQNAVNLKVDITDNSATDKAFLKRFGLVGPPAILFIDPQGQEIRHYRQIGFVKADKFIEITKKALKIN
jgi:thiol:disulfide interchange protein DsbD